MPLDEMYEPLIKKHTHKLPRIIVLEVNFNSKLAICLSCFLVAVL
jgi:hypothetical protein